MKPTIGRIVHYVLPDGPSAGQHRPAIVVYVWQSQDTSYCGSVQLQVFTDSDVDQQYNDRLPPVLWKTSVMEDPTGERIGTWHWPERDA